MPIALDTNVLIYAELEPQSDKGRLARSLIKQVSADDGILPAQVIGEFLAVVRRQRRDLFAMACQTASELPSLFWVADTDAAVIRMAIDLANRHRLQIWDSVICAASMQAGATHLLSEDMQDGSALTGLTIVNPFVAANLPLLNRLLPPELPEI